MDAPARQEVVERLRAICLALPEVEERVSHGHPAFFVRGGRQMGTVLNDHHGDGRFALWCPQPEAIRQVLLDGDVERFFVPPYVGHRGWVGVRLDRGIDWDELAGLLDDAWVQAAPKRLLAKARGWD